MKYILFFLIGYSLLCMDFSLIVASRGYSLVTVPRLLTAVASLVAEHRLWCARASVVAARGLTSCAATWISSSVASEIFPDQELNSCPLDWQVDSYPLSHRGGAEIHF